MENKQLLPDELEIKNLVVCGVAQQSPAGRILIEDNENKKNSLVSEVICYKKYYRDRPSSGIVTYIDISTLDEYCSYDSLMPARCNGNGLYIETEWQYYSYFKKQLVEKGLTFSDTIKLDEVLQQVSGLQKSRRDVPCQLDIEEILSK